MSEFYFNRDSISEIYSNALSGEINESFKGVSSQNFKWIYNWCKKYGLSLDEFFKGVVDTPSPEVFSSTKYFTNNSFNLMLQNVALFLEERFPDEYEQKKHSLFRDIGREAGGDFKDNFLSYMPIFTGRRIEDIAYYARLASAFTTLMRIVSVDDPKLVRESVDGKPIKKMNLNVRTFPGHITSKPAAYYYFGRCERVLSRSSDTLLDLDIEFSERNGSFIISGNYISQNEDKKIPKFQKMLRKFGNHVMEMQTTKTFQIQRELDLDMIQELTRTRDIGNQMYTVHKTTGKHMNRVAMMALFMARQLGLSFRDKRILALGAPVHDYGKIVIPDTIIHKGGRFSLLERKIMEKHALAGEFLLLRDGVDTINENRFDISYAQKKRQLEDLIASSRLASEHQEWFNGSGYPFNRKEEEISFLGHLMKVVDVFDALISSRVYKEPLSYGEINHIMTDSITRGEFHPLLGEYFVDTILPFLESVNYGEHSYDFRDANKLSRTDSLVAFLRGNNDKFTLPAPTDLLNYIKSYPNTTSTLNERTSLCTSHMENFFEDLAYTEIAQELIEGEQLLNQIPEQVVDVSKKFLNREVDLSELKSTGLIQYTNLRPQKSLEYIHVLREKLPPLLLNEAEKQFSFN